MGSREDRILNQRKKRVLIGQIKPAVTSRNVHFVKIPVHHEIEDVLQPSYWAQAVYPIMRDNDVIEFAREDYEFEGELRVVKASTNGIVFKVRFIVGENGPIPVPSLEAERAEEPSKPAKERVTTEFKPGAGWRVLDDGKVATLRGEELVKLGNRANAEAKAAEYLESVTA